jgi:sigma-54 dependent transcriptional regulator, flagellar regulatory protein
MTSHFVPRSQPAATRVIAPQDEGARLARIDRMIPGKAPVMQNMKRLVAAMAPARAPVLVTGPSGTGKELVAQALHDLSGRTGAFIAVNCAAIPAELLEGELFGSERGAYTGADRARAGLIEQAQGGTLFLDEIGDMPAPLQAKLLRVLESRVLRRLGGNATIQLDFRLVAATHCDLASLVAEGGFRQDLFYRLSVFPVAVPPLADRIGDLPVLMERLLDEQAAIDPAAAMPEFDASAMRALAMHGWPGNVRELKTVILRACLLFAGRPVTAREVRENLLSFAMPAGQQADTPWPAAPMPAGAGLDTPDPFHAALEQFKGDIDLRSYLRDIEVAFITAALERTDHCVSRAADRLRLRRTTLIEKLKKYGITATA